MKTNKTSKRALLTSVLSIALCLSMLIGTTFAWFTDTATTSVSKIVSGKLDIDLVDASNQTVTGRQLNWQTADDRAQSAILWEPGCTYNLEPVKLVNNGNLAAKCAVKITGVTGSNKLLEALDWTLNGEPMADQTIVLYPTTSEDRPSSLELNITASMKTTAGNEYQNLTLDGIAITVYATQAQYESDSEDNTYDAGADMTPDNLEQRVQGSAEVTANADTTVTTKDASASAVIPAGALTANTTVTLSKTPVATSGNITVEAAQSAATYEISLTDSAGNKLTAAEGKYFTVTLNIGKDLAVVDFLHNGVSMKKVTSTPTEVDAYYYSTKTGIVTFTTDDFSPFTAIYKLGTKGAPYLISTAEQALNMENEAGGFYKLMADIVVPDEIYVSGKKVTFDLNGHSVKLEYGEGVELINGGVFNIGGKGSGLTINDSSPEQTGAVIGSDKTYDGKVTSAVRVNYRGSLTINGGNFRGTSEGTSCIFTAGRSATVKIYGGTFQTATPSNGMYYVLNHQDGKAGASYNNITGGSTMTVYGGSFKNYNPGVTPVDPVNSGTGVIKLADGYVATETKDGSDTWYTVSKAK